MGETMKLINEVGKGGKLKTMLGNIAKGVTLIAGVFCIVFSRSSSVTDRMSQAVKQAFVISRCPPRRHARRYHHRPRSRRPGAF